MMANRFRFLACSALLALAPTAQAEDLLEIYQLAQQSDPTWNGAQANYRANLELWPQARSLLLPTISAGAGIFKVDQEATRTDQVSGTILGTSAARYTSTGYNVQISQPLFNMSGFAAFAQGRTAMNQAEAELAIARQDLIQRTAQAYFDVLAAQDALEFARTEKNAIKGQLDLAQRNYSVGNATVVDVHEARARQDLAAALEVSAESDLQVKQEALITLTGITPATPLARPVPRLQLPAPEPADPEHWLKAAADQNLQIKVQEYLYNIASEEVKKVRGGHYPTLDLVAGRVYSDAGGGVFGTGIESTTDQIGLQLQVPIYQGGYGSSKVREAVARREQAREALTLSKRQTTRQAREAFLAVTSGATRVRALEQALASSQKALEGTLLGYESGVRTGVDVLNAQRELYRTKRDLSQARYAWLTSRLRLKAAIGTLNDTDLAEINRFLTQG